MAQRPANFRLNHGQPLAKGLVFAALGNCHGCSSAFDSSRFGNHGALTNMDPATDWVWSPDLGRWALDFDGSNDYCVGTDYGFAMGATARTTAFWAKFATTSLAWRGVCSYGPTAEPYGRLWYVGTSGYNHYAHVELYGGGISGTTAVDDGAWHHILAACHGDNTISIYLDGLLDGGPSVAYPTINTALTGLSYLGRAPDGSFSGAAVCDVMHWSRVLSQPEIEALADPSNVMLSGMILPPRRRVFPTVGNRLRRVLSGVET